MITCPNCGKSHYSEGPSMCTAVYYPPIWKDGINTNPDMNERTTEAHCYECDFDFEIHEQGGNVWTILKKYNPPKPPLNVDISTACAYSPYTIEYVPDEYATRVSIAHIDKDGNPLREKTKVEKDIKEIQDDIKNIKQEISDLRQTIVSLIEVLR